MSGYAKHMGLLSIRRENSESFPLRHESYVLVNLEGVMRRSHTSLIFVLGKVVRIFQLVVTSIYVYSIQNWVEDFYWKQLDLNYPRLPVAMVLEMMSLLQVVDTSDLE